MPETNKEPNNRSINPNKTESIRELGQLDINDVKTMVLKLTQEVWDKESAMRENDFNCFEDTRHIIFRFPEDVQNRTVVHDHPIWNVWRSRLESLINSAVKPFGYSNGKIAAVMLARLKAGGKILSHQDGSPSCFFLHKIHIPIQTNEKVRFFIDPKEYHLKEGIAYEVNNVVSHGVVNDGDTDRIHLIFEFYDAKNHVLSDE